MKLDALHPQQTFALCLCLFPHCCIMLQLPFVVLLDLSMKNEFKAQAIVSWSCDLCMQTSKEPPPSSPSAFISILCLIKPYTRGSIGLSEHRANYRISRARRVVENFFGICASTFCIFRRPIVVKTELVIEITKAVGILHNFLMLDKADSRNNYSPQAMLMRRQQEE